MRAQKNRLRSAACALRGLRQPVRQGQIAKAYRTPRRALEQIRVRLEVGIQAQRAAPNHYSHVVAVVARCKFTGQVAPQPPQPRLRRSPTPHLAVKRVRDPDLDAPVDLGDANQAADIRLLDGGRGRDPVQRRQLDRLADRQRIDSVSHPDRQVTDPGLDQLDQARRHHRFVHPLPITTPLAEPLVRDRLLDDVAQIQRVALRQPPQAAGGIRLDRPDQRLRQQRRRILQRQRLHVDSVELSELPKLLHRSGNRLVDALREHQSATPRCTICCSTNIDKSSRRCGSSTPISTGNPDEPAVNDSITSHTRCRLSPPARPAHDANAPSGSPRPHDVPTTHRTSRPDAAAAASASRAIRLFPTPEGPQTTAPDAAGCEIAASIRRTSLARPTNGHANRIHSD